MRFYHRLALALGMTVKRMLAEMDADELAYWIAYDSLSPIGHERSDIQTAQICQTIGNRSGGKEENTPFKLTDYLIDYFADENSQNDGYPTPEELLIKAKFINSMVCEINQAKQEMRERNAQR